MMGKHTAQPLTIWNPDGDHPDTIKIAPITGEVGSACHPIFYVALRGNNRQEQLANAAHLVACWNACEEAGIERPELILDIVRALELALNYIEERNDEIGLPMNLRPFSHRIRDILDRLKGVKP